MKHGKLLIVDDDADLLAVLAARFTAKQYEVTVVADGAEALTTFDRVRPDVVLLDLQMPGLDGLSVLRRLRGDSPEARVVMVTGSATLNLAEMMYDEGACELVTKPIDYRRLDHAIEARVPRDL